MMIRATLAALAVFALTACANDDNRIAFDGQYFKARSSKLGDDRADFEVTVSPASASIEGAQEAGRHQSAVYCITNFGISEVDWQIGPDQDPESYAIENDTLVLRGRCVE